MSRIKNRKEAVKNALTKNGAVALKLVRSSFFIYFNKKNNCQTSKKSDSWCKLNVCTKTLNYKKIILKIQMDIN